MKKLAFFSLLFLLLVSSSCTVNCPDDEKVGAISLSEESLAFFPYAGKPVLVFKNEVDEELRFTTSEGVKTESTHIAVHKTCTEFKYDGGSSYEYYLGETKNVFFQELNQHYALNLGIFTSTIRPETELFYDKLLVDVSSTGTIGRGEIVTDIRFNEAYEEEELNIDSPMELLEELTLNGVTFTQIYQSEAYDGRQMFYTKEQGVVGFTHNGHTYHLDRVE